MDLVAFQSVALSFHLGFLAVEHLVAVLRRYLTFQPSFAVPLSLIVLIPLREVVLKAGPGIIASLEEILLNEDLVDSLVFEAAKRCLNNCAAAIILWYCPLNTDIAPNLRGL